MSKNDNIWSSSLASQKQPTEGNGTWGCWEDSDPQAGGAASVEKRVAHWLCCSMCHPEGCSSQAHPPWAAWWHLADGASSGWILPGCRVLPVWECH
jgi:hypothetical protein